MPSRCDRIGLRKLALAIWLGALLPAFAEHVRAEVRVSGQADALTVVTREASVEEVLAALRASFNLNYRTSGALNRVITGTYTGSLPRVIARLLEGHNYVMQASAGGGELIVFGPAAAVGSVAAAGRQVVANVGHQNLPGPPIVPTILQAKSATQVSTDVQASSGSTAIDNLRPTLGGREMSSDKATQTMPPLPNATLDADMPPVTTVTSDGNTPPYPAAIASLMPPLASNSEIGFGPPILIHPASLPIPQSVQAATVGP
jgi:hypothetical protein